MNNNNKKDLQVQKQMMRDEVTDLELKARYWKAQYDIAHYTLEYDKLKDEYAEYVKREQEKQEQERQRFIEALEEKARAEGATVDETK